MRNGQKRMRGRNNNNNNHSNHSNHNNNNQHRKSQNPLTRVYESNGPDVKIRGTASTIAEKYIQLARDSQSSGDPVAAENYYQHAEHYFRLIAAAQEQFRQQNPYQNNQPNQQPQTGQQPQGAADDNFDDDDDGQPFTGQNEPGFAPQPQMAPNPQQPQPQPFIPRDAQPFPPRDQHQPRPQQHQQPRQPYAPQQPNQNGNGAPPQDVNALPAFITGGGGQPQPDAGTGVQADGQEGGGGQDRFGHRRRRRHRPGGGFQQRPDNFGNVAPQGTAPSEGGGDGQPD